MKHRNCIIVVNLLIYFSQLFKCYFLFHVALRQINICKHVYNWYKNIYRKYLFLTFCNILLDSFVHLFKERIAAKPKFSKKSASDILSVQPHSRRFTMPLNIYNYKKDIIFNLYAKLFQSIRNTIFMGNNNSSK